MKKLLLLPLLFLSFAQAETIQCKVVGVYDGDSITCLTDEKEQIKVKLFGIDAPELDQPYGQDSKQYLTEVLFHGLSPHTPIKVKSYGKDAKGFILGRVYSICPGCGIRGTVCQCLPTPQRGYGEVNMTMISQGYAWQYSFSVINFGYVKAEQTARKHKFGLWADKKPVAPWEWRKKNKPAKPYKYFDN